MFKKKAIDLKGESEKFKIQYSYNVCSEKNLGMMHVVCTNGVQSFKYPKETGVPSLVKEEVVRTTKLGIKGGDFGLVHTYSLQLDLVVTYVQ